MSKVTARFNAALRASHTVYEYVDVIGSGSKTVRLHVTSGSVNVDRSGQQRRSAQLVCYDVDGSMVPTGPNSILAPYGTEFRPYRGIQYTDGTIETYPLGVFQLSDNLVTESNPLNGSGMTMNLTGYDRSRKISRDKFDDTYTIAQGAAVTDSIQILVRRTYPDAQFDCITHAMTLPYVLTYAVGDDPWQACTDLASSIGCDVFFDVNGVCCVRVPADISALGSPDWDYIEGQGCTMTDISRVLTDSPGYNGVIVVGASPTTAVSDGSTTGVPVQGVAWDTEPTSPTYYKGPYGKVPLVVQDQTITTAADAVASAQSQLNGMLGFTTGADITCWCNPAIDIDDVIQVERQRVNVSGKFVVDSFQTSMGSSSTGSPGSDTEQTVVLRQMRTLS